MAFALILKKLITFKVSAGTFQWAANPRPSRLNIFKTIFLIVNLHINYSLQGMTENIFVTRALWVNKIIIICPQFHFTSRALVLI